MLLLLMACVDGVDTGDSTEEPEDTTPPMEDCDVEGDEDGDGAADCDDEDCEDAEACEEQNLPASAPVIAIEPAEPTTSDALECLVVEPGVDPENLTVIHRFSWAVNGEDAGETTENITSFKTTVGDTWTCQVVAWDGYQNSEPAQTSVTILE